MADAFDGGEEPEPLILTKKITLEAGGHGGAWKVAYADFVTAMMAFFLLLWLLNATTEEQVNGLSDYFAPSNIAESEAGLGEALSGLSAAAEKSLRSDSARPSVSVAMPSFGGEAAGEERGEERESETETKVKEAKASEQEAETERLNDAMEKLRQSISETPETADLQENLLIDQTKDGLRIQILDKAGKGMFEQGTADLTRRAIRLLALIGSVTADLPNEIAITGHTDTTPPPGDDPSYGKWELSGDRAAASRGWLVDAGLPSERIVRVAGKADTEPLIPEEPNAPSNRRVSILILRQTPLADGAAGAAGGGAAPPELPALDGAGGG